MESKNFRIPAQDFFENQDPEHRATDAISGANCVPEQTVLAFQRDLSPHIAQFRVVTLSEDKPIGIATSKSTEARVTQSQRIEGVVTLDEGTGILGHLDFGTPRGTNSNAAHVPVADLDRIDLAETTKTFLGAGNKRRIPIGSRSEVSFQVRKES
jgi:hypothetical protein